MRRFLVGDDLNALDVVTAELLVVIDVEADLDRSDVQQPNRVRFVGELQTAPIAAEIGQRALFVDRIGEQAKRRMVARRFAFQGSGGEARRGKERGRQTRRRGLAAVHRLDAVTAKHVVPIRHRHDKP